MAESPDYSLYFIAMIPPPPIYQEVHQWKEYFSNRYGSRASLNSPPHMTLHMPFRIPEKKEARLINELENLSRFHHSFELCADGFGAFEPRVIFININSDPKLQELQYDIQKAMKVSFNIFNANHKDRPFHPHLTLAFRDLKKEKYHSAWQEFKGKTFHSKFFMKSFSLLKHDHKQWNVLKYFPLPD